MAIRRWWKGLTSPNIVGSVMIVFTLISLFQVLRISNISECTAAYQAGFSAALSVRGTSQEKFNRALVDMVYTVVTTTDRSRVPVALQNFLQASAERDQALRDHPYPNPTVCNA